MIIERLVEWMETADAEARAKAAGALVRAWEQSPLDDDQLDAAEAAMTCILDDPDDEVRLAFSKALSETKNPPRHLVIALAHDVSMVSVPVLVSSAALMDAELAAILRSGTDEQEMAIACRHQISSQICNLIAREAGPNACLAMITNPCARLGEADFYAIAERHGRDRDLRKCLLARDDVGIRARVLLIEHYALSLLDLDDEEEADEVDERRRRELIEVCDKATITFAAQITDMEIREVVKALIERQKLTTSFLLRAICMGNLSLFAHALCVLSGQSLTRVERVVQDNRSAAFHAIYSKAGLPVSAIDVFRKTITVWRHHLAMSDGSDHDRLPYLVTREVISTYEGGRDSIVDELMVLLRRICTDAARDCARNKVERLALEKAREPLALPAPQTIDLPELTVEELTAFAYRFADELAEQAIRDEQAMNGEVNELVAANQDEVTDGLPDLSLLLKPQRAA